MTHIDATLTGTDTATHGKHTAKTRNGPICKLARQLVEAGFDTSAELRVYRDGVLVFDKATIGTWADLTTGEPDNRSVHMAKFRPFDVSGRP